MYIVENPAVFFILAGTWQGEVIVCGNGQMALAALALPDLSAGETHFFYADDLRCRNKKDRRKTGWEKYDRKTKWALCPRESF